MATRGKKVEIYYTSQGTTTGIDASALVFDGKNLNIYTHNKTFKGTDTTYDVFGPSGSNASSGLVPAPGNTAGSSKFLREDGTWTKLNLVNPYVGPTAELDASVGYINATPGVGQGNKFFRSDGTWVSITKSTVGLNNVDNTSDASKTVAAAGKATNLAAGAAGSIPYQSASNSTAFLAAGSNGQILAYDSANNKPYWKDDNNTWKAANASQEGYVPKSTANKILRSNGDGALYWGDDSNTWKAANTSQEGYVPKLATGGGTIATQASEYVLTFKSGTDSTPVWRLLPSNAYSDHTYTVNNNTYRIKSKIGDATTTISDFTANQASDDDFTLIQGSNITFTNDTTNRTITIAGTANTWKPVNTSQEGYVPKLTTGGGTIATQSTEYVLTFKSGTDTTPVWRLLPSNAYNDHTYTVNNNTYRIKSKIGDATTTLSDFTANQSSDDDFTLVQGSNITFTNDATNRTLTIAGTANTWKAANTSQEGYIPKLATGGGTIATQASEYVLTFKSGTDSTPVWRLLPANAYNDHTYTVNNNTFRIKSLVGSTTTTLSDFTANQASDDDFTLVQGSNITFTVDATNRKLTIAGTANTWKAANASQEGYVPKSTANKILRSNGDGALYWGDDTNTWRPVGTGATDAAAGNHTHGISIAADSGTNQISLAAGTKYKLTAGGQSYIFTTPADSNTDTKVSQVDNNGDAARPILVKNGTGTGTVTDSALFADGVTVNPSNNSLSISGNLSVTGTASFSNNVTLTAGGLDIQNATLGDNLVYGGGGHHASYHNIILRGNTSTGVSGIGFTSSKGTTSINVPSDCAFIQFHPYNPTLAAVGTNPTLGTSGESNKLIIGVNNDADDMIYLQTPNGDGLKHVVGTSVYNIITSRNISSQSVNYATTASQVKDAGNNTAITFKYSSGGFTSNPSWLGAWNGYQLTYVSPSVLSVNYATSAGSATYAGYLTLTYCNSSTNSGLWNTIKNGSSNTVTNKVNFYTIYNNGGPTTYGEMLEILSYNANHWQPQLWFAAGKSAHLYYRNKNYNDNSWGNWLTILDSDNSSVSKSGETLTVKINGTSQSLTNTNTTYSGSSTVTLSGTTFSLTKANVTTALGYTPPTTNSTYNFSGTTFRSGYSSGEEHNANNAWENGHYYYTSNGPSGLGNSTSDGALYVQSYNSSWVGQIAQDYRNGRLWVRGKNNGTWQSWVRIANYNEIPSTIAWSNVSGKPFNWSGQSGQPSWLWGSNDGTNYYVWNPSNFSVNYANSAGSASSASTSSQVTINYNNDSNSNYQMLWGSGNSVYGTGGIYCNPYYDYLYATNFYTTSDVRRKTSIKRISKHIYSFYFKENLETLQYGVIAQEVETENPELVDNSGKYKTVNYNSTLSLYVAELENKVEELEKRIKQLENG